VSSELDAQARRGQNRDTGPKTTIYADATSYARNLAWRPIGPANHSGRIVDLAVDPTDHNVWYIAGVGRDLENHEPRPELQPGLWAEAALHDWRYRDGSQ
jgi:hypothetical protein